MTDAKDIILTNCVCVCLKIITVSDMTNAAGDELDMSLCNDVGDTWSSKCELPFVRQDKPGPTAWQAWKKALKLIANNNGKLHQKLGKWKTSGTKLRRRWPTCYLASANAIYFTNTLTIAKHPHVHTNCFDEDGIVHNHLPEDSLPVDVSEKLVSWKLNHRVPKRCIANQTSAWNA